MNLWRAEEMLSLLKFTGLNSTTDSDVGTNTDYDTDEDAYPRFTEEGETEVEEETREVTKEKETEETKEDKDEPKEKNYTFEELPTIIRNIVETLPKSNNDEGMVPKIHMFHRDNHVKLAKLLKRIAKVKNFAGEYDMHIFNPMPVKDESTYEDKVVKKGEKLIEKSLEFQKYLNDAAAQAEAKTNSSYKEPTEKEVEAAISFLKNPKTKFTVSNKKWENFVKGIHNLKLEINKLSLGELFKEYTNSLSLLESSSVNFTM